MYLNAIFHGFNMTKNEYKRDVNPEDIVYRKAKVFLRDKDIVHLSLHSGTFYNGRLFSVNKDYLEIHDRKFGKIKVFLIEIKHIEEYEVRE